MVWADRGIRIDWPNLQIDVGKRDREEAEDQTLDEKGKVKGRPSPG